MFAEQRLRGHLQVASLRTSSQTCTQLSSVVDQCVDHADFAQASTPNEISLEEHDIEAVDAMLCFMYRGLYHADEDGDYPPLRHAAIYALTEEYTIPKLKALSLNKFSTSLHQDLRISTSVDVVRFVYTDVLDQERALRTVLLRTVSAHIEVLSMEGYFVRILYKIQDFSASLTLAMVTRIEGLECYRDSAATVRG
jgi:hypothetical protein